MSDESGNEVTPNETASERPGGECPRKIGRAYVLGTLFPLIAAAALYGWRALGAVVLMLTSAGGAIFVWRRIGSRGPALLRWEGLLLALLLALMLPAHLLSNREPNAVEEQLPWAIIPAAALLLVMVNWLTGSQGYLRLHPVLVTYLVLVAVFGTMLSPRVILHRNRIFTGDLANCLPATDPQLPREEAWMYWRQHSPPADAVLFGSTAAERLSRYTTAWIRPGATPWFSLESLLRDAMPPLENLIAGGHPGPIGASSIIAVLIGGLFLLHRGAIDYRIPLLIVLMAFFAFMVLPVPVIITETRAQWRPIFIPRAHLDWATMLTFANYELMASPLLFTAFFLATLPSLAPEHEKAKAVYAVAVGLFSAAAQIYLSCSIGPYIGLLLASQFTPWLDERARGAPLMAPGA